MATVIVEPPGAPQAGAVLEGEVIPPAAAEAEAAAEASVEVAAIQAGRDVEIAQIQADEHAAELEALTNMRVATLEAELAECRTQIANLETELSTRPPLVVVEELPSPEGESPRSSPEPPTPSASEPPPPVEPPAEGTAPEPPPPKRRKLRWI